MQATQEAEGRPVSVMSVLDAKRGSHIEKYEPDFGLKKPGAYSLWNAMNAATAYNNLMFEVRPQSLLRGSSQTDSSFRITLSVTPTSDLRTSTQEPSTQISLTPSFRVLSVHCCHPSLPVQTTAPSTCSAPSSRTRQAHTGMVLKARILLGKVGTVTKQLEQRYGSTQKLLSRKLASMCNDLFSNAVRCYPLRF